MTFSPRTSKLINAAAAFLFAVAILGQVTLQAQVNVVTNRNNNGRTSLNDSETFLTPANVKSTSFAKLGAYNVDGYVVAQPLYLSNVSIGGVSHNVVFVATQHDSVYAFDADNLSSGIPLWQISFINPSAGIGTVPVSEQGCSVVNGYTEMGIQGTPVIDPATGTLYVDVKTKEVTGGVTSYFHRLHALDVTSGAEKFNGPVVVTGSVSSLHGPVLFDALKGCQRPGLLLTNGNVYVAFSSNGCDNAHGWVFAYNAANLSLAPAVFNTSPNQAKQGAIWQGGAGLAADDAGNVFFITANGTFDVNMGGSDYGDTFMKLTLGSSLSVADYFTPFDQLHMSVQDLDLGSGGAMLLSDPSWPHPNEVIGAGKTGTIYVVDRDNMGHYLPNDNSQIIQSMQDFLSRVDGTPAYWNGMVYFAPAHAQAVAFSLLSDGTLSSQTIAHSQSIIPLNGPVVSSNGNTNGVVWILRKIGNTSGKQLSAFDGGDLHELYNTTQAGSRDALGATAHLIVPTIANGKTYVGTQTQLVVYGLLPPVSAVSGNNQTGAAGSTLPLPLTVQVTDAYTGAPISGVTLTFSGNGSFGTPNPVTDSTGTASTTYTFPNTFTNSTVTITVSSQGYAPATFTETVTAGSPASIVLFGGGSQNGTVGTTLPAAIVYKVTDQFGNPVPGASVTFADSPNHGIFSPNPAITAANGRASVSYTLPTKVGFVTVTPSIGSLTGPGTQERALAGSPATIGIVSGNNQTAHINTPLAKPLVVRVADQYNNAIQGVTVTYTDNSAGGIFGGNPATTNSGGQASVTYTTPGTTGTITINATVPGVNPAGFTVRVIN